MFTKKTAVAFLAVCLAFSASLCLNAEVGPPAPQNVEVKVEPAGTGPAPVLQSLGGIPKFLTLDAGQCTAGGPGSTSCTYGSCTVSSGTCKGDDYPCCGSDVCGCSSGAMF